MNLDFYIKKKHIFKNRHKPMPKIRLLGSKRSLLIYCPKKFRLDFVIIRLFKKLLRRKFIKAKTRFFKPKYWLFIKPNYLLTQKSKNSRMGAGVGKLVRLTNIINPGKTIFKTWYYTIRYTRAMLRTILHKLPVQLLIKNCYK